MSSKKLSDALLISMYLEGNESALETLVMRHKDRIFGFIYSKVLDRDIAEDIFQDTFIKVINTLKRGGYNEEGKFLPWVLRIAHNLVIDHFRHSKKIQTVEPKEDFDVMEIVSNGEKNVEEVLIHSQIHEDVKKLIMELPEEQMQVLILRHYSEMSFKDIAEATDVSINTALGRMRYALINLRRLIKEKNLVLTEL